MLNPKLVPLHRNLPDITDKKDLYALHKGLLPAHNPSFVQLEKIRELILNVRLHPFRPTPFPSKSFSKT
jgi:hypothetical protein